MGREEIAKTCVHKLEWSFIVFKYSTTADLNFKCIFFRKSPSCHFLTYVPQ